MYIPTTTVQYCRLRSHRFSLFPDVVQCHRASQSCQSTASADLLISYSPRTARYGRAFTDSAHPAERLIEYQTERSRRGPRGRAPLYNPSGTRETGQRHQKLYARIRQRPVYSPHYFDVITTLGRFFCFSIAVRGMPNWMN